MTFVVDTGVLWDHLHAVPEATRCLHDAVASGRRIVGSVVTRIELRREAEPNDLAAIEAVERLLDWVAVDHEIAAVAEQHAERYGRSHPETGVSDYVIAATAERLDADLLTFRPARFPMYPGLAAASSAPAGSPR